MMKTSSAFHLGRREAGNHTEFWRLLSWCVGDRHAYRICWLVDVYCRLHHLSPSRLHQSPRRW